MSATMIGKTTGATIGLTTEAAMLRTTGVTTRASIGTSSGKI
jgi:hypothetical protein